MLGDYRSYLLGLRNSLIRCGVEVPINPIDSYRDLFYEGIRLDNILWYYSVLAVSGSENALSGFILPLNGYYKERMRQLFYEEFLGYLPEYKKISKAHMVSYAEEQSYCGISEPTLLESQPENMKESPTIKGILSQPASVECFGSKEEYVHGIYIEDILVGTQSEETIKIEPVEDVTAGIVHGVYIEDICNEMVKGVEDEPIESPCSEGQVHGIYIEGIPLYVKEGEKDEVIHGTYIEDISLNIKESKDSTVHGVYIEDISFDVKESKEDDAVHGIYIEDISVEESSSVEEIHGIYIEDIEMPEDEDSSEYEEAGYVGDDEEYVGDDYEYVGEENQYNGYSDESENYVPSQTQASDEEQISDQPNIVEDKPDLADNLTKLVNTALTKGRRLIYKELQKINK